MPDETVVDTPPAPASTPEATPSLTPAHAEVEAAMSGQHNLIDKMKEDLKKEQEKLDVMVSQHNRLSKPIPEGGLKVNRADPSWKTNRG